MALAASWIRGRGGIAATRVFTRIWLALFGEWPWEQLPVMPPELIYLPRWFPLNVYDWACWARQTIVPLTVVCSIRPVRPLPFGLAELDTAAGQRVPVREQDRGDKGRPDSKADPWGAAFRGLDRVLHRYERHASHLAAATAVRTAAFRRCADWIIARQEQDGCWGGIQPPWVYSLMALHLLGYGLEHPVIRRGLDGLDRFTIWEDAPDGKMRRLEACQSPVWDTVLAMVALADAGLPADDPALQSAARWVLAEEIRGPGDWQVQRPGLAPSGWAFEFDNDGYPDIDDTAEVVLALGRVEQPDDAMAGQAGAAVARALDWLTGMQSRDGGWGAFDADNTSRLVTKLPFCDFGEVVDPPSADVTAHTVEALAAAGLGASRPARRGVAWLLRAQEPDGSWFGRWGVNYVYGTSGVLRAFETLGLRSSPECQRAAEWLRSVQNSDGGFGESILSYYDPALKAKGKSTASQTAWGLIGLLAVLGADDPAVERAVGWLVSHQNDDGTWDEPEFTGTGFPQVFYLKYHLYRNSFPLYALARYDNLRQGRRNYLGVKVAAEDMQAANAH
jgi:squalene-hopene/tetraprenyl-beta-curcumene cyclase